LIGAVIGAGSTMLATRWAIRGAADQAEKERKAADDSARQSALMALAAELKHIHSMLPTHVSFAHVPMPRDAYSTAMRYLSSLPVNVQETIQRATYKVDAYNSLAQMSNARDLPGRRQDGDKEAEKASAEARAHVGTAMNALEVYLGLFPPVDPATSSDA
jgi:FAD/FMN-containing dehydrogenase